MLQTVFDPVVADRETTVDEYSIEVTLPDGVSPEELLAAMTRDMDDVVGGEFAERGDFRNLADYEPGDSAAPGDVIDIDIGDVLWTGPEFLSPESPFNAPVIVTASQSDRFVVQTIELDTKEHLLHGTREWGFETLSDGAVRFYTRGVSVEDIGAARLFGGAQRGERAYWTAWVDGVGEHVEGLGGSLVEGGRVIDQTTGPSGNELWSALDDEQREAVRASQIDGLGREVERLENELQALIDEPGLPDLGALSYIAELSRRRDEVRAELEGWRAR